MNEEQVDICLEDLSVSKFDTIIEWLLISLLAFMPFAFGAVEPWSEEIVLIIVAIMTISFLLKLIFEKHTHLFWSWSYVPVALFIIVVVFQIIPIPVNIINKIAPNTVEIKKDLLSDLPDAKTFLRYMTLSFYPNATKHDLRLVLSIASVFFIVANTYRRKIQIKRLLSAIAVIGGLIALLALAQDLFGNGRIFWKIPTGSGEAFSGTFINHSHYGQFMNLSIGAALGLIFIQIHEAFQREKVTTETVYNYLGSYSAKSMWFILLVITIGATTVFVSLTRGGMISMLIAAVCTTLALGSRHNMKSGGWIIILIALFAFVCVLYIGFDAVYDRLSSLRNLHQAQASRWQILKDISLAWTKFPFFGTGLGTHEVVYPMFDRSTIARIAAYAENEYAQTAEETGLIGLATLVVFGISICLYYIQNVKNSIMPIQSATYGLGFGLLAILIHSLSDFGQHIPANAFLSAIFCALLLALTRIKEQSSSTKTSNAFIGSKYLRIVISLSVSVLFLWIVMGADNARIAETHWKKALTIEKDMLEKNWQASNSKYEALIKNAVIAADYQPENVKYQHWLNVYRWESISNTIDPNTGKVYIPEPALGFVPRVVDELHSARKLCPTYGATYCIVGQLERFILDDPNGTEYIRKGYKLAPCDPVACFVTAFLDVKEQNIDASFVKFKRSIELDESMFSSVADIYINDANRPDLAIELAKNNSEWLSYVANAISDTQKHADIIEQAQKQIIQLLKQKCSEPDVSASALASLANYYRKENDNKQAIEYYRRALSMEYNQVDWHYSLAKLLADMNKISEAIHEARICLRIRSEYEAAENLIKELSVKQPDYVDDNSEMAW